MRNARVWFSSLLHRHLLLISLFSSGAGFVLAIEAIPVRRKRLGISLAASADCCRVFPVLWRHLWPGGEIPPAYSPGARALCGRTCIGKFDQSPRSIDRGRSARMAAPSLSPSDALDNLKRTVLVAKMMKIATIVPPVGTFISLIFSGCCR